MSKHPAKKMQALEATEHGCGTQRDSGNSGCGHKTVGITEILLINEKD